MSSSEYCNEYTVGCCPFEEFFVHSVTKRCARIHDEGRRTEYAKSSDTHSFEAEVLANYRGIIEDVDKKIAHSECCLSSESDAAQEDVFAALEYAEKLIEDKTLDSSNTAEIYYLLRIHGQLLQKASVGAARASYSICKRCGAPMVGDTCKHHFCPAYGKIRKLCKCLEAKLGYLNK